MEEELELFKTLPPLVVKGDYRDVQMQKAREERDFLVNENSKRPCAIRVGDTVTCRVAASTNNKLFRVIRVWAADHKTQTGWLANAELIASTGDTETDRNINSQVRDLDSAWFILQPQNLL